jgi:hypothetical protein
MSHLGDANKMVSDTPRTNKEEFLPHDSKYRVCDVDFARTLERELNAANDRIKRLEEAGDLLTRMVCKQDGYGIYQDEEDAVNSWHKAKEAKP